VLRNKRDFIQATDILVLNSPNINSGKYDNFEFPQSLYILKLRDLENKVKAVPNKVRTDEKYRAYARKIREHFLDFFLNDLLDIKNCNYTHHELFLSHQRKKKISKEHFEFIKLLSTTQTFKNFQVMLKNPHWLDNVDMKKWEEDEKVDQREIIKIDENLTNLAFNNLQEKYYQDSEFIPIKQIIVAQKGIETASYRYTYVPRLLELLSTHKTTLNNLHWPEESSKIPKIGFFRDIFNPEPFYTYENIKDAIWLTCWIG